MELTVNGEPVELDPGQTLIYYVDEKAPEFSMQGLKAGIIAVIVVVVLAVIAGIVVLVSTGTVKSQWRHLGTLRTSASFATLLCSELIHCFGHSLSMKKGSSVERSWSSSPVSSTVLPGSVQQHRPSPVIPWSGAAEPRASLRGGAGKAHWEATGPSTEGHSELWASQEGRVAQSTGNLRVR